MSYLVHHGILGQKWGIRRFQNPDGSYTPQGQSENNGHGRYSSYKERLRQKIIDKRKEKEHDKNIDKKYRMTKKDLKYVKQKAKINYGLKYVKQKANAIVSSKEFKMAAIAGVALCAAYVSYRIVNKDIYDIALDNQSDQLVRWNERKQGFKSLSDIPKATVDYYNDYFNNDNLDNLLNKNNYFKDPSLLVDISTNPFKALSYSYSNPEEWDMIPNRTNNCMLCTTNLIMRLKGYETMAQETSDSRGWGSNLITELFKDAEVVAPHKYTRSGVLKELSKQGPGAYGNFMVFWKTGGGHSILYTVKEDGVHFIDGQIGKEYTYRELFSKIYPENVRYSRLDKCDIKDEILKSIEPITDNINDLLRYS